MFLVESIKKTFLPLALMSLRILLLPFSVIYGLAVFIRNTFYDLGVFTENRFDFPVISIGNLTTGGTGKTPHVEYLIKLLQTDFKIATLSRGYRQKCCYAQSWLWKEDKRFSVCFRKLKT